MKKLRPRLADILDTLEEHYGAQRPLGPSDPYEMILFVNCGYPATDASCTKGYDPLKAEVGTKPEQILKSAERETGKTDTTWRNVPGVTRGTAEADRANREPRISAGI